MLKQNIKPTSGQGVHKVLLKALHRPAVSDDGLTSDQHRVNVGRSVRLHIINAIKHVNNPA